MYFISIIIIFLCSFYPVLSYASDGVRQPKIIKDHTIQKLESQIEIDYENRELHIKLARSYFDRFKRNPDFDERAIPYGLWEYITALDFHYDDDLYSELKQKWESFQFKYPNYPPLEKIFKVHKYLYDRNKESIRFVTAARKEFNNIAKKLHEKKVPRENLLALNATSQHISTIFLLSRGRPVGGLEGGKSELVMTEGYFIKWNKAIHSPGFELIGDSYIGEIYSIIPKGTSFRMIKDGPDKGFFKNDKGIKVIIGLPAFEQIIQEK